MVRRAHGCGRADPHSRTQNNTITVAIAAEKVLELAAGNPVLVGYLAYVVGLLIAIAAVKAS